MYGARNVPIPSTLVSPLSDAFSGNMQIGHDHHRTLNTNQFIIIEANGVGLPILLKFINRG